MNDTEDTLNTMDQAAEAVGKMTDLITRMAVEKHAQSNHFESAQILEDLGPKLRPHLIELVQKMVGEGFNAHAAISLTAAIFSAMAAIADGDEPDSPITGTNEEQ